MILEVHTTVVEKQKCHSENWTTGAKNNPSEKTRTTPYVRFSKLFFVMLVHISIKVQHTLVCLEISKIIRFKNVVIIRNSFCIVLRMIQKLINDSLNSGEIEIIFNFFFLEIPLCFRASIFITNSFYMKTANFTSLALELDTEYIPKHHNGSKYVVSERYWIYIAEILSKKSFFFFLKKCTRLPNSAEWTTWRR